MKNSNDSKPVGPLKTAGVWLLLAAISITSFLVTNRLMTHGQPPPQAQDEASISCFAIVALILSIFVLCVAAATYLLVLGTNCFTFNFEKPVWNSSLKARLYIANILVTTALMLGFGGIGSALGGPLVSKLTGMSRQLSFMLPFLAIMIPGQLLFVWFTMWNPLLTSLTRKSLATKGISPEEVKSGIYVGVSNPDLSSMKKFSMIEDDLGILWLTPEALRYRGDNQAFQIGRGELTEIERRVDKGSVAAYAGAVHIVLHWKGNDGTEQRKRLHAENCWTLSRNARMLDEIARMLEEWKRADPVPPADVEPGPDNDGQAAAGDA